MADHGSCPDSLVSLEKSNGLLQGHRCSSIIFNYSYRCVSAHRAIFANGWMSRELSNGVGYMGEDIRKVDPVFSILSLILSSILSLDHSQSTSLRDIASQLSCPVLLFFFLSQSTHFTSCKTI